MSSGFVTEAEVRPNQFLEDELNLPLQSIIIGGGEKEAKTR